METEPSPAAASRAPRRDAVRNDAVVVAAARKVFGEQGPAASMEAIAAQAGLGVGTIYRRFAGKEALLAAIAHLFAEEMDEAAAAALDEPDPGVGLERFLEFIGTFNAEKRRYAAALADQVTDDDVSARTVKNLQLLTERAVDYGVLAPGVDGADIKALIIALRGVVSMTDDGDDTTWRRFLRLHLAGLRVRI